MGFGPQRLNNVRPCTLESIPNHEMVQVLYEKKNEKKKPKKKPKTTKEINVDSKFGIMKFPNYVK